MDAPIDPLAPDGSGGFDAAFSAISALVAIGIVLAIVIAVYRGVRMANRGQNPLTLEEDLVHQVTRSQALSAPRTKADRLAELDALLTAGSISGTEHAEARSRILAE